MNTQKKSKLSFSSDYMEGAHPELLKNLLETNMVKCTGYGFDGFSESARAKIRAACDSPLAEVFFLSGGTQTNIVVIDALLRSYQGVISAETGHINYHEAGGIEFHGHKILSVPHRDGKIMSDQISDRIEEYKNDLNREHTVAPGMVYISQPTEYGTLYSLDELKKISDVCRSSGIALYLDGARLAYALACPENDVTLPDIARLCDVFYIGGTKCGSLFGEAVVIPNPATVEHFFTVVKQHGALLAKGRVAGIQFDALFTDGLYFKIGENAIKAANRIRNALREKNYSFAINSPTNQIFIILDKSERERLEKNADLGFWETLDDGRFVMRIATSWASDPEDVSALISIL